MFIQAMPLYLEQTVSHVRARLNSRLSREGPDNAGHGLDIVDRVRGRDQCGEGRRSQDLGTRNRSGEHRSVAAAVAESEIRCCVIPETKTVTLSNLVSAEARARTQA